MGWRDRQEEQEAVFHNGKWFVLLAILLAVFFYCLASMEEMAPKIDHADGQALYKAANMRARAEVQP